jgi:hypothetical protein
MKLELLKFSILLSALIAALPVIIMLINRKMLFKRSYGFALFGIFSSHFLAGVFEFVCADVFRNAFPVYHFYNLYLSFFFYWLFSKKLTKPMFKNVALLLLVIMLSAEFFDFFFRGGLFSNNNVAYPVLQFSVVMFYFLYLMDTFKNAPETLIYSRSEFGIYSTIFVFAILQFLFALIENDIRYSLTTSSWANVLWAIFVWAYIVYLIISSYLIWKNMRSSPN